MGYAFRKSDFLVHKMIKSQRFILKIQVLCFVTLKEKMEEQKLAIPIEKIKNDFQEFLNPQRNRRIIFSGPFGIGKTYFLNEFFVERE